MKVLTAMLLMAAATPVTAMDEKIWLYEPTLPPPFETPTVVTEKQKADALKNAYREFYGLNTVIPQTPPEAYKEKSGADDARPVKTERIMPVTKAGDKNAIDEQADAIDRLQQKWVQLRGDRTLPKNVCEEHGMRKVTSADGRSWRCRK